MPKNSLLSPFSARIPVLLLSFWLPSGCYVDATGDAADKREETASQHTYAKWETFPNSSTYEYFQCKAQSTVLCGTRPELGDSSNYSWNSNCKGPDCVALSIFAHYTLADDLGSNQTLVIEGFDNARFSGSPVASMQLAGFDARGPHSTDREEIYVSPGEYYFRAYLHSGADTLIPYPLNGMELVGEKPVGVFGGALSGASRVLVLKGQLPTPIHINIDQVFKRPGSEVESQAKLRLKLLLSDDILVPNDRQLQILLLKNPDLEELPLYSFSLSSNLLLSPGVDGSVEFVSPSLKPGSYFVFAYIDMDSDGLFDEGEAHAFFRERELVQSISIVAERIKTVSLLLEQNPAIR